MIPGPLLSAALGGAALISRQGPLGRRARRNLELAFGSTLSAEEREQILRGSFTHSTRLFMNWLRLSRGAAPEGPGKHSGAWIDRTVAIDPTVEILEQELSQGRGAIIITAHIGDWELGCAALRRRGVTGSVVGLERRRDPSTNWLIDMRRGYGVETIPQDSNPRQLLRVLKRGEVLGLLPDLEVRRLAGEFVPFFGRAALTMSAPAALARASGARLIPMRCIQREQGYRLMFESPLGEGAGAQGRAGTSSLLQEMNRTFERWIREDPNQWAWHQHRWRTGPGELRATPLCAHGEATQSPASTPNKGRA